MAHRILVVEDDPLSLRNVAGFLQSHGYEVEQASDGLEALDVFQRQRFDVVISDLRMPRMDGRALVERVRKLAPDTRILITTAYLDDGVPPGIPHLAKPLLLEELLAKIRELLAR
jgi:CheY-like chemotaxis protein